MATFRSATAFSRAALMILFTRTCDILVIVQIDRMDIPSFARSITRSTSRELMRASLGARAEYVWPDLLTRKPCDGLDPFRQTERRASAARLQIMQIPTARADDSGKIALTETFIGPVFGQWVHAPWFADGRRHVNQK